MVEPIKINERFWQEDSHPIIQKCNTNGKHNAIPVNACVGSGKTNLASFALGDFIMQNKDGKTFQMFVTPRIKLCKQQSGGIAKYIKDKFGLVMKEDYNILRYDSSVSDEKLNLSSSTFTAKHAIVVVCDESLWGVDDNKEDDPDKRWHRWIHFFNQLEKKGYLFGNCIFDEAHNYTSMHKKIFGDGGSDDEQFKNKEVA